MTEPVSSSQAVTASGLGTGVTFLVGEASTGLSALDPTLMIYSLAAGAMTLLTLLVKDKLVTHSQPTIAGKNLLSQLEKLAYGVEADRQASEDWRELVSGRLDSMQAGFSSVEASVESLRVTVQHLADESPIPSWRSDANGHCVWASQALLDLVGFTFEDGFKGVNWANIFPAPELAIVQRRWEDSVRTKNPFSLRTRYQHKDGTTIPVDLHATFLPDWSFRGVAKKV